MKKLVIFTILILAFLFHLTEVKADPIVLSYSLTPEVVWIDKKINILINCYSNTSNETVNAWFQLNYPISTKVDLRRDGYKFFGDYSTFPYLGNYLGAIVCADINGSITNEVSFSVRDLSVNILGIEPSPIYPDSEWKIFVEIKEVSEVEKKVMEGVNFRLFSNENPISLTHFYDVGRGMWVLLPQKLSEGDYEIKVIANYQGREKEAITQVKINPILLLSITSFQEEVLSNQEIQIGLRAEYRGNLTSLKLTQVKVEVDAEEVGIKRIDDQSILITTPKRSAGPHEIKIKVYYRGYENTVSRTLEYVLEVAGNLIDAEGKAVNGRLRFSKAGYLKDITVNGPYSGYVPKGRYTVEFYSPSLMAIFNSVDVEDELKDFLRVDPFGKNIKFQGLKVAGGAAIEMIKRFQDVEIELAYDSRIILNEPSLRVFGCENWNFLARSCTGEWKNISAEVDTIRDMVRFRTTSLSAFVVGEMSSLNIIFSVDKDRYFLNEPIAVNGVVRDDEGNTISEANISYVLDNLEGTSYTKKDGIFSFSIISPSKSGEYTLIIEASKKNYFSARAERTILVEAKKDLAIIFGLQQTIEAGRNQTIQIKVINSGQTDLHNLRISVTGLPLEWFDFSPTKQSILKQGEELTVTLQLSPPLEMEAKSYNVKVDAITDEVERTDAFVLILQPPLVEEKVEEEKPSPLVGFFIYFKSLKVEHAIIFLAIVAILIILALKLRRKPSERVVRIGSSRGLRSF